ncbi:unnamed protein product [Strongylus vulgaris]|uniref:Uncharacterized protein n=1 Tax=Strongylus vulgaris TaxID=40348 RepID=A0A3P7IUC7_STRVU|nr:unnamed protein product [Strongylus vulgaris]
MFQWSMSKMHIRAAGEFQASLTNPLLLAVPINGYFEALLGHVALTISVQLQSKLNVASNQSICYHYSLFCRYSVLNKLEALNFVQVANGQPYNEIP